MGLTASVSGLSPGIALGHVPPATGGAPVQRRQRARHCTRGNVRPRYVRHHVAVEGWKAALFASWQDVDAENEPNIIMAARDRVRRSASLCPLYDQSQCPVMISGILVREKASIASRYVSTTW